LKKLTTTPLELCIHPPLLPIDKIAYFVTVLAMRVHVLALNGVFDTGLATVLDAFATANELAELSGLRATRFDVAVVGVRCSVRTSLGLTVPVCSIGRHVPDCVVVPAIGFKMPDPLRAALAEPQIEDATTALRGWARQGATMTAACIGTFVLAESGLLDGHHATTTWWLSAIFRERYPRVRVNESKMIVKSGSVVTAGAALGHMDLAIWLIRQKSPALASLTAKYLIVDSRPSQSAYALADHLVHSDPIVERFERWARANLAGGFSLVDAAKAVHTSKRTLARRTQAVLGQSPLSYVQTLRIERAVHLLKTTKKSVDTIAGEVGYAESVTLRVLLRRRLGIGIREIRRAL
jgi:transcriptional regulator GlxA family with amidase domain